MKKKCVKLIAAFLLLCVMVTAFPLNAFAGEVQDGIVTYYTDDNGIRTGIKRINLSPYTYYDCSGGKEADVDSVYLYNILKEKISFDDTTSISILDDWASIAAAIFENEGKYTCADNYADQFGKKHGNDEYECYVRDLLADPSSKSNGSVSNDNYHSTGLTITNSLSSVRNKMGEEIADRIKRKTCSAGDILGQGDNCDDALLDLKDDTTRDVIYNIVTSISRSGATAKFTYNSYGIAFYDFDLSIIADEDLEYISDAEAYRDQDDSIKAAHAAGVAGTNYESSNDVTYFVGTENYSAMDVNKEISLNNTTTSTVGTSLENTEGYSYEELVGSETELDSTLKFIVGGVTETIQFSFTANEFFQTAYTEENSLSSSVGVNDVVSVPMPAQTVGYVEQGYGTATSEVSYDVPVALTFKVAIFSMSGDVYADKGCVLAFSTSGYTQSNFSTIFGTNGDSTKGLYAYDSLYKRYTNKDVNGWDGTNGNNHKYYKKHDGSSKPTDLTNEGLKWNNISTTITNNCNKSIDKIAQRVPMLTSGAVAYNTSESYNSIVYDQRPMYLPTYFVAENLATVSFNMDVGGAFGLNQIKMMAYNKNGVPYYGYFKEMGHWEVCPGSEDILYVEKASNSVIAKAAGIGNVQYVLNDGIELTADKESGIVTAKDIPPYVVSFAVKGEGTKRVVLTANNNSAITATVGDEPVYIPQLADVKDTDGNSLNNYPIAWETEADVDGATIDENNCISFTEDGTYKIRAVVNPGTLSESCSDWLEITPREKRVIASADFDIQDVKNIILNFRHLKNGSHSSKVRYDIASFVNWYDQYGDKWTGEPLDIAVTVDNPEGAHITDNRFVTLSEAGKYNICVKVPKLKDAVIGSCEFNVKEDVQYELGDTDNDNYRTIKDATLIQKYLANIITVEDMNTENADINRDNRITISDATAIQKFLAKINNILN